MKKLYFLLLACLLVLISCSSDNEESTLPIERNPIAVEGKQVFQIEIKEITAKTSTGNIQKNLEPAYVLLSIDDTNGIAVLTREKIALVKEGENYKTAEITLNSGSYTLTEFIVTDSDDVVISMAPRDTSVLAQFANKTLPFDFSVSENETNVTSTENIIAAGYTSVDFGYTGLSLNIPQSTDFFTLIVDDSETLTSKTLNLKSITGSTYLVDWGDGNTEEYVSTIMDSGIDNTVTHTYADNGIYTINISGAVEAIEVFDFTNNEQDKGFQSHLTSVNLEKLTLLKSSQLYAGNLITLNTSENKALEFLGLGYNQITNLDFTNNTNLKTVWLRYNQLTELDVSQNPNMEFLWVEGNQISNLNLTNNTNLKVLLARENNLNSIDFSNNLNLERFDIANNNISNIDISGNLALFEINVGTNQLTSIDLSNNTNLLRIDLYENQLASIDVSKNLRLRDLYLESNPLSTIDLSANPDLERLYINNNNFSILDLSSNTKISHLNIGDNQFDGAALDQILLSVYNNAILNAIRDGYINYINNIGTSNIDQETISKMNELIVDYNWFFNNG